MDIIPIVEALADLETDMSVPKNVRLKINSTLESLQNGQEKRLVVNQAIYELGEIADDCNMQSHVRTQIFTIVSMLENIH